MWSTDTVVTVIHICDFHTINEYFNGFLIHKCYIEFLSGETKILELSHENSLPLEWSWTKQLLMGDNRGHSDGVYLYRDKGFVSRWPVIVGKLSGLLKASG